jgi:hypothetical protein
MNALSAVVRNGGIELKEPLELPDGLEVEVTIRPLPHEFELRGMTEEEQGDSPEAVENWIAMLKAIPTPAMSDDEWSAWQRVRNEERGRGGEMSVN